MTISAIHYPFERHALVELTTPNDERDFPVPSQVSTLPLPRRRLLRLQDVRGVVTL